MSSNGGVDDTDADAVSVVPSASAGKRKRVDARDVIDVDDDGEENVGELDDDNDNDDGSDGSDGGSGDDNDDDDATNEEEEEEEDEEDDDDNDKKTLDEQQQAPVRRVGRPRKHPLASPPTATVKTAAAAAPTPRRRGRPPKQPRVDATKVPEPKQVALVQTIATAFQQTTAAKQAAAVPAKPPSTPKAAPKAAAAATTSSGSARVQKSSSTTATSTSSAPQPPPPPPVPARASGTASSKSSASAASQAVQRPPAVQPVADAVDHFVNLDDAAAWHQFRPLLATFISDIVANRDGKYEVARFNNKPATRAEYASTLARISGGGGNGGVGNGFPQFAAFVYETAVMQNQAAYVPFAARFHAPLHESAHVDFLCPLVYRRLCAVARVHGLGLGGAVERFVLSCNLLTEIETHQRRVARAAAAAAEQEEE